jgi:hypothetical protein
LGRGESVTNLIQINSPHPSNFHPITQIYEMLIRAFFLFGHQPVPAKKIHTNKRERLASLAQSKRNNETNPLTPTTHPCPNSNPTLNCALFGASWKRIWERRSSIRLMEIDLGRVGVSSPSSSLASEEGRRTDYGEDESDPEETRVREWVR